MIYSAHAVRSAALATERVERRLAAILTADVAGYSRLMGADEEGTLARLKAHRRELIDPKISEHRGRIVKTTGDGLLVEFTAAAEDVGWPILDKWRPYIALWLGRRITPNGPAPRL